MHYTFLDFLTLIGSLGLFLYGMKVMSEGLQKVAGEKMRSILSVMTSNRLFGVLTGVLITALIQSSSATTLMVVSFVNAGLLSLAQSVSVIMGANVGTTVTAWVISLFGFKVDINSFALPLLGLSIPLIFAKKSKLKSWGEFIAGFALLFLGLINLKHSMPDLQANPEILSFLQHYTNLGYGSVFIFLAIGTIMTIVVQSSSATVALTLIMCSKGWIPFEMAAAMVLGENIGTTITANLAAIGANINAKRAALSHLLFNIFGVIWVLCLFYPFTGMVAHLVEYIGQSSPYDLFNTLQEASRSHTTQEMLAITSGMGTTDPSLAPIMAKVASGIVGVSFGLSLFHTMFNICNVLIMVWFVPAYVYICSKILPGKTNRKGDQHLQFVDFGMLSTSELTIVQAKKEIAIYGQRVSRMLEMNKELLIEKDEENFQKVYNRIEKYENISDRMEVEIANYLTKLSEGRLSSDAKEDVRIMLRSISEVESMGDACYNIARTFKRLRESNANFNDVIIQRCTAMMDLCTKGMNRMNSLLEKNDYTADDAYVSYNIENEINNMRDSLKASNMSELQEKLYSYQSAVYYMDIIEECEKFGDYALNVVQALVEKKI